jgi:hypothetical protein
VEFRWRRSFSQALARMPRHGNRKKTAVIADFVPDKSSVKAHARADLWMMTGLMGIPVLGEWPPRIDWVAIALISIGVYVVSGGPFPRRTTSASSLS